MRKAGQPLHTQEEPQAQYPPAVEEIIFFVVLRESSRRSASSAASHAVELRGHKMRMSARRRVDKDFKENFEPGIS